MRSDSPRPIRFAPLLAALLVGGLAVWAAFWLRSYPVAADGELLSSSSGVLVERGSLGLSFLPSGREPELGLVFYVGAKVRPEAYAYLGRALAERGYAAFVAGFPLEFALFDPARAEKVAAAFPSVKRWIVGGHSLGGAMAATWAGKRLAGSSLPSGASLPAADLPAGLLLLASYPGGGTDLSSSVLPVLSISASQDGLATPEKVDRARSLLPAATRYVKIAGGNHAQFGEYGPQPGDGAAVLPGPAQRRVVVDETLAFLGALALGGP